MHLHDHNGPTGPSGTDQKGLPPVAKSFSNISGQQANGFLILSRDSFYASVTMRGVKELIPASCISVVGQPMLLTYPNSKKANASSINSRQSFLGPDSPFLFDNVKVCIVGYGGGGSHIGQQLAHIGVKHLTVYDGDRIEDTNMNRLIGAWFQDVKAKLFKTEIAKRAIRKIIPHAVIRTINSRWQKQPEYLQEADIVIAGVDSYADRQQLEAECRRYLIPAIDMGMDVFEKSDGTFAIAGQIILSMPGMPCLHCFQFLTPEKLAEEAAKYGNVGHRPQVVWPNGVLASSAIGVFVDLVTGWTKRGNLNIYLQYDGTNSWLTEHPRGKYAPKTCTHYPLSQIGAPTYTTM